MCSARSMVTPSPRMARKTSISASHSLGHTLADGLARGVQETHGQAGVGIWKEAVRSRSRKPELGRPTDRARLLPMTDQLLLAQRVEMLAHRHCGDAQFRRQGLRVAWPALFEERMPEPKYVI